MRDIAQKIRNTRYAIRNMVYTGTWLVLATLAIIVTLFWLGYYWARTHGLLDDMEAAKYAMLENERAYGDERYYRPRT